MNSVYRIFLQTFLGFAVSFGGGYLGYLFLLSINTRSNYIFLIGSIVLFPIGAVLLYRAGKLDDMVIHRPKKPILLDDAQPVTDKKSLDERLQKNNKLTSDWAKTMEQRDKLRLIELSDSANTQGPYSK